MAFWTCNSARESKKHRHDFDEYTIIVAGHTQPASRTGKSSLILGMNCITQRAQAEHGRARKESPISISDVSFPGLRDWAWAKQAARTQAATTTPSGRGQGSVMQVHARRFPSQRRTRQRSLGGDPGGDGSHERNEHANHNPGQSTRDSRVRVTLRIARPTSPSGSRKPSNGRT